MLWSITAFCHFFSTIRTGFYTKEVQTRLQTREIRRLHSAFVALSGPVPVSVWKGSAGHCGYKHTFILKVIRLLLSLHRFFRVTHHMWSEVKLKISLVHLGSTNEHVIFTYPRSSPCLCLGWLIYILSMAQFEKKHIVLGVCARVWGSRDTIISQWFSITCSLVKCTFPREILISRKVVMIL